MGFLLGKLFRFFIIVYVGFFFFYLFRPAPSVLDIEPAPVAVSPADVTFLADVNYTSSTSVERFEDHIFPSLLDMIAKADRLVLADMFLLNEFQGTVPETRRDLTADFTAALGARKLRGSTSTEVVLVTDPINRGYGGIAAPRLDQLSAAGVRVYETPLDALPDSNHLWSTFYRMLFRWAGNSEEHGWLPNPLDHAGAKVTLRTYANLFNFKANHRKVLVADERTKVGRILVTHVGSLNPHTASSANGNVALVVRSTELGEQAVSAENVVLSLANLPQVGLPSDLVRSSPKTGGVTATYLTEASIQDGIIDVLDALVDGDKADIAVFYLSDRDVIRALERARGRGVAIRILLDQNESAFGKNKHGIPNQATVERLLSVADQKRMEIRWCASEGEQCHAKMLLATAQGRSILIVGSANYTRRNLDRFNLESAIRIDASSPIMAIDDAHRYMDRMWTNAIGETSLPVDAHRDRGWWKRYLSATMEWTGISTF